MSDSERKTSPRSPEFRGRLITETLSGSLNDIYSEISPLNGSVSVDENSGRYFGTVNYEDEKYFVLGGRSDRSLTVALFPFELEKVRLIDVELDKNDGGNWEQELPLITLPYLADSPSTTFIVRITLTPRGALIGENIIEQFNSLFDHLSSIVESRRKKMFPTPFMQILDAPGGLTN